MVVKEMIGTYCTYVGKFDRGQLFRRYCVRCVYNMAHHGDKELQCRYLQNRKTSPPDRKGEIIPGSKPSITIPLDLR